MIIEIRRPKDLTLTSTVAYSDYLVLDQGESGVFKVSIAQLTSFFVGGMFSALALSGEDDPEGAVSARPPTIYMRVAEGIREIWMKTSGVDTTSGWELIVKAL